MKFFVRARGATLALSLLFPWTCFADTVGRIEGTFSVSDAGAANYSIPIKVTPGIAGMDPKLSLIYSSQSGDGLLGMGWELAGLSSIYRCAQTIDQDGATRGVSYDSGDQFCLDGQKLRAISGGYGADGTEYRTEIESFQKVLSHTSGGTGTAPSTGPKWFEVKTRNGVTIEYGATDDVRHSRIEAQGKTVTRVWAIDKITDINGNYITFSYAKDSANGSFRPTDIAYTGTLSATPNYHVYFDYEARPTSDVFPRYTFGSVVKQTFRMTGVRLEYMGSPVSQYTLAYEPMSSGTTGRSRLASITLCARAECLPATTFSWQSGATGWGSPVASTSGAVDNGGPVLVLDANGDGTEDVAYPLSSVWTVRFGQRDGKFGAPVSTGLAATNKSYTTPIDYNGDGRIDLMSPDGSPGNWKVAYWDGSAFQLLDTGIPYGGSLGADFTADINGDGLDDVVWIVPKGGTLAHDTLYARLNTDTGFEPTPRTLGYFDGSGPSPFGASTGYFRSTVRRADLNADGQTDLFILFHGGGDPCQPEFSCPVSINTWQGYLDFGGALARAGVRASDTNPSPAAPFMLDMNGDGNTDVIYVTSSGSQNSLQTLLSSGDGNALAGNARSYPHTNAGNDSAADWDNDGRDDLLVEEWNSSASRYELSVYRSDGVAFANGVGTGIPNLMGSSNRARLVMDVNGDGLTDLAFYDGSTWYTYLHNGLKPDLLSAATDGFGNHVEFAYAPLGDPDVHTRGVDTLPPFTRCYQGPMYVVRQVTANDGTGGTYTQTYSYRGAKIETRGRGFLGFAKIESTDSRNGLTVSRSFLHPFPYTGLLEEMVVEDGEGDVLSNATYTVKKRDFRSGAAKSVFRFTSNSTVVQHELDNSFTGRRIIASDFGYDDYGNLVDSTVVTSFAFGDAFKTTVHREYDNDTTTWCLGLMNLETVQKTLPTGETETRKKTAVNETALCRVKTVTDQPGSSLQVDSSFQYDAFGNQNLITVTGFGMTPRPTHRDFGTTGQFLETLTNAQQHSSTSEWDRTIGTELTRTDPNGLKVKWNYDGFGKSQAEERPDRSFTTWTRQICALGCGIGGTYKVTVSVANPDTGVTGETTETVFDSLDRPLEVTKILLGGRQSHVLTQYDSLGRVISRTAPFFTGDAQFASTFTYDVLNRLRIEDRPLSETQGSGRMVHHDYSSSAGALAVTDTDPKNHATTRYFNAIGQVTRVNDARHNDMTYDYWPFGEPHHVTDAVGNSKVMNHDVHGNMTSLDDPDAGLSTFQFDPLGELSIQETAKKNQIVFDYDLIGRVRHRTEPEDVTTWDYDTAPGKGVGKLATATITSSGVTQYARSLSYDDLGRVANEKTTTDGTLYQVDTSYDSLSRVSTITYPDASGARFAARYVYDAASGLLKRVENANNASEMFWRADNTNAWNQVTGETLGNGLSSERTFDRARGVLSTIETGSHQIQNLSYAWDPAGNLQSRTDLLQSVTETAVYDELNRLTRAQVNSNPALVISYDEIGNIASKSDTGTYSPDPVHVHAVGAISGAKAASYSYDVDGNMLSGAGRALDWTSFDYPSRITEGSNVSTFAYGPDRMRYKQIRTRVTYAADSPPRASFTVTCSGLSCSFDASQSSDDAGIVSYSWNYGDGQGGSGSPSSHAYSRGGSYTITLTIADVAGQTSTTARTVQLDGPPIASFAYSCTSLSCSFDGTSSWDESGVTSYSWAFGDGQTGTGSTISHTYAIGGSYVATLTVADASGHSSSISRTLSIDGPPSADFTFYCSAGNCSFNGSGSADDRGIASYAWAFGDGASGTGSTTSHSYAAAGSYTVTLTVTDAAGQTGATSKAVTVAIPSDNPPTANYVYSCTNLSCQFDGSNSSDDHGIVGYRWDFGDGASASGMQVNHAFPSSGTYTVVLTVTDTAGRASAQSRAVTVSHDLLARVCEATQGLVCMSLAVPHLPDPVTLLVRLIPETGVGTRVFYAPAADTDGTFLVYWGEATTAVQDAACSQKSQLNQLSQLLYYQLEMARNLDFSDASVVFRGLGHQYQFTSLPPGTYRFRISAYVSCNGQTQRTDYFNGPNTTVVGINTDPDSRPPLPPGTPSPPPPPPMESVPPVDQTLRPTGTETTTITYVGGIFERRQTAGGDTYVHYIVAAGRVVAIRAQTAAGASMQYLHTDHLGSVDTITDEHGALVERFSYDAFGKRRMPDWTPDDSGYELKTAHATDRGFTFHEQLDHVELVHMNGRVYDPTIGRFVSADPTIPDLWNAQGHDRYSYVLNNPLSLSDPSGHTPCPSGHGDCPVFEDVDSIGHTSRVDWAEHRGGFYAYSFNAENLAGLLSMGKIAVAFAINAMEIQLQRREGACHFGGHLCDLAQERFAQERFNFNDTLAFWSGIESVSAAYGVNPSDVYLEFNGRTLAVKLASGEVLYESPATSGKGQYMNDPSAQRLPNEGPIPEGTYYFDRDDWRYQSLLRQAYNIVFGNGDWGDFNVPLTPVMPDPLRNSFYLHGGFFPGSAGCIDAGGNIEQFVMYTNSQDYTAVIVNYHR